MLDATRLRLGALRRASGLGRLPWVLATQALGREYLVLAKELRGAVPAPAPPDAFRMTALTESDVPRVAAASSALSPGEILRRLEEGQTCSVWWLDGQPVHWRWETAHPAHLPYLGRALHPGPGELWVVEVFTVPAYRSRGLYTASTALALARARATGFHRVVGMAAPWNRPALHVMRAKFERTVVGAVGYWGAGPWRAYYAKGAVCFDDTGAVCLQRLDRDV